MLWRKNVQKVRENQEIYWVAAPKNSDFLDKIPGWVNNKSLCQVCKKNFSMQNLKKMNNQIMGNFELKIKKLFQGILIPRAGRN